MARSSTKEMLREIMGPDNKDPRKLLANVWIIRDEDTGLPKEKHPWVMIETRHPVNPIYKACTISTDKRNELDISLPPETIEKHPHQFFHQCYIRIGGDSPRLFGEFLINKGEHKLDLPESFKQEIRHGLSQMRSRNYRKDSR